MSLGATWDVDLLREVGEHLAEEVRPDLSRLSALLTAEGKVQIQVGIRLAGSHNVHPSSSLGRQKL